MRKRLAFLVDVEFVPGQLFMLAQFVACIDDEVDVFFCYAKLLQHIGSLRKWFLFVTKANRKRSIERFETPDGIFGPKTLDKTVARLITIFRTILPAVYVHFEDEEVPPTTWPVPWLKYLLAAHLPAPTVARLVMHTASRVVSFGAVVSFLMYSSNATNTVGCLFRMR